MNATTIESIRDRAAGTAKAANSIALLVAGYVSQPVVALFTNHVKGPILLKVDKIATTEAGQKLTKVVNDTVLSLESIDFQAGVDAVRDAGEEAIDWLVDRKDDAENAILDATTLKQRQVAAGVIVAGAAVATITVAVRVVRNARKV